MSRLLNLVGPHLKQVGAALTKSIWISAILLALVVISRPPACVEWRVFHITGFSYGCGEQGPLEPDHPDTPSREAAGSSTQQPP